MLVVETIGKIRRAYFVQGKPIKAICRELKVSRKVVRKVLRSVATSFEYEREVQSLPKIGPWKADLERILAANASRAARERLTLMRVFEELRGLGYQGGYEGYGQSWCLVSSSGLVLGLLNGFAVAEVHALDHLGETLRAVRPAPVPLGGLGELEDHGERGLA